MAPCALHRVYSVRVGNTSCRFVLAIFLGRRGFESLACSEGFPAIMLYSWPNNCPTIPFKIGFHRNPGRGFASSRPSLI